MWSSSKDEIKVMKRWRKIMYVLTGLWVIEMVIVHDPILIFGGAACVVVLSIIFARWKKEINAKQVEGN